MEISNSNIFLKPFYTTCYNAVNLPKSKNITQLAYLNYSQAAAVQVYEERARNMQLILDQQERIADTSLTLEMQRIEAEQVSKTSLIHLGWILPWSKPYIVDKSQ